MTITLDTKINEKSLADRESALRTISAEIEAINNLKESVALAKELNVSRSTVAMWETNSNEPDNKTIVAIANILNISTDELLDNIQIKKPVHVDEPEQGKISPEKKILLSAYDRASDDDRRVLWTLLDKYMTPNEKEYFSQSEQEYDVG